MSMREHLSRRERQVMDILYREGSCSAHEVLDRLPAPPSYSAVRAMLRILEQKGHVQHHQEGQRYVYKPVEERRRVRRSALKHLVQTFFEGSTEQVVAALLSGDELSRDELDRLAQLIDKARKEGR